LKIYLQFLFIICKVINILNIGEMKMKTIYRLLLLFFLESSLLLAQWVQTNGPYDGDIWCFAVRPNGTGGTNLFAGTNKGVFLSTNNGTSWTSASTGLTNTLIQALVVLDTNLFAGNRDGVFLSNNNGTSWTWLSLGWTHTSVRAFAISGTSLFAGTGGGGVYRSTDKGLNWIMAGLTHVNVRSLAVSPANDGTGGTNLFAGTNGSGVYRSNDNGRNWTSANTGLTYAGVLSLADSPNGTSGTNLIAGTWGGIFISTNDGTSWTEANTGLTFTYVYCLTTSGTNIFAGTWDGVFLSIDNGTNWIPVSTGLTNTDILSLVVVGNDLFAGTDGGVWKRPLPEMITSVNVLSTASPKHFILRQNYPNPFNPATTISFEIPLTSFVSLKVFDGFGREVATLISEELSAANYAHKWNAEGLPSGVYFYRMSAKPISGDENDSFFKTKKLILLK
jgi:hypothetical protein